jgi:hypothetical protein
MTQAAQSASRTTGIPRSGVTRHARVDRKSSPAIFRPLRDLGLPAEREMPLWRNW